MATAPTGPARGPVTFSIQRDILASLVVFLVALPLCIAIAKACDLPPETGIITGIIGGLVVGPLAGSPLQVSGPAAGLIVLVGTYVTNANTAFANKQTAIPAIASLGVVVFLAGLIQIAMAGLRLGHWFRAVSPAVILGMLAGIGAVIIAKQIHVMVDDEPAASVTKNITDFPKALRNGLTDTDPAPPHHRYAALVGCVSILILIAWPTLTPKKWRIIPAALLAVLAGTILAMIIEPDLKRIDMSPDLLGKVTWLTWKPLEEMVQKSSTWVAAFSIAVIASAETLLCATATDRMHSGPRTNYNRELFAQGVGNTLCGVLGVLPMTGVIVRSSANVKAGATSRLSATLHGLWLVLAVLLFSHWLDDIPLSVLAAVLVYTGFKLLEIKAFRELWSVNRVEFLIGIATFIGVVFLDLLSGVIIGIVLAAIRLLLRFSQLVIIRTEKENNEIHLELYGSATFVSLPKLAQALEKLPNNAKVHVHIDNLDTVDHACLNLLSSWASQHRSTGGELTLDMESLHARFQKNGKG